MRNIQDRLFSYWWVDTLYVVLFTVPRNIILQIILRAFIRFRKPKFATKLSLYLKPQILYTFQVQRRWPQSKRWAEYQARKTFQIVIGLIAEKSLPQKVHTHLAAYDTFVTYELLGNGMV